MSQEKSELLLRSDNVELIAQRSKYSLERPSIKKKEANLAATKQAIDRLILDLQEPDSLLVKRSETTVQYSPEDSVQEHQLRIIERQNDPLEPPRHRYKKTHEVELVTPESRAPILRKPAKQLSKEETQKWHVPQSISNWKNSRGYMIDRAKDSSGRASNSLNAVNKRLDLTSALEDAANSVTKEYEEKTQEEDKSARLKLKLLAQKSKHKLDETDIHDSRLYHNSKRHHAMYDSELFTDKRSQVRSKLNGNKIEFEPEK